MAKAAKRRTKSKAAPKPAKPMPDHWPADQVERWPLAKLLPHARNARTHSEKQVDQLAASMREFGWTIPVLVDEAGTIIAGHGRVLAAKRIGSIETVPVMVAVGWDEERKRSYMLADNKLALNAGWDEVLLGVELADLSKIPTVDMAAVGFSERELQRLIPHDVAEGLTDPDALPEGQGTASAPISRPGDVWLLGEHRLLCGDSSNADHVAMCLDGALPHLMVTDPPYGVNYDPSWRDGVVGGTVDKSIRATGLVQNDGEADWRKAWALFAGDVAYVWHGGLHAATVAESLAVCGFQMRAQIVWAKNKHVISRGDYHWQHEPCWYAVRKGATGHWNGDRSQRTLWEIANMGGPDGRKEDVISGHGTQKPVECMLRPILNNSKPGDSVYEPFSGSGTTIIAAEQSGRRCLAIEIDPAYVDMAVERWENFTGKAAILAGRNLARVDVKCERNAAPPREGARSVSDAAAVGVD